jgi:hypothetical protein
MKLSYAELKTIENALYTAADRYRECKRTIEADPAMGALVKQRIVDQFQSQIDSCAKLLDERNWEDGS